MALEDHSDTESESQASVFEWDATDFAHISTTQAEVFDDNQDGSSDNRPSAHDVLLAISELRSLDASAAGDDDSLHLVIQHISTRILGFIDDVGINSPEGEEESAFGILLELSFIALLFEYRQIFHRIAARDAHDHGASPVVVCWVDVILAKLGEVITFLAGHASGVERREEHNLASLKRQREGDALRAATQLPSEWDAVPNMISAEYASPAAARLALRLTFGVYVMGPQLAGSTLPQETSQRAGLMKSLRAYIDRTINTNAMKTKHYQHQEPADLDIHATECFAMFLCLFSVVSCAEDTEVDAQFLPHTHAALLRLIASVICPVEFPSSPEQLLSPYLKLDTAQVILLTWGKTIPWSWCVWADPRIAYAEIIDLMSSTWLFHIGGVSEDAEYDPQSASAASWEEELTAALSHNPTAAIIAIIRILNCAVSALLMTPPAHFPSHCLDVIYRCCWAAAQLFQARVNVADAVATQLCSVLCRTFILLQQDNGYKAKDQILEALSSVQAEVLRSVMKDLCKDAKVNLAIALESRISHFSRYIDNEAGRADLCHKDLSGIRQLLQFNTLTWHHGIQTGISVPVWTSFLRGLVHWLASVLPESEAAINLRDALICALATFALLDEEGRKQSWDDETVWNIAINSRAANLTTACALSSYISATIRRSHCSPLAIAESWNYLRDALLLILTHQFFNIEEPLAILICPSICQALMHLLRDSGDGPVVAVQYMLSSPWSINLCASLQDLAEVANCQGDSYRVYLHARAMPFASALLEHMRAALLNDHQQHDLPTADTRLLMVGIHCIPHPILVLEHRLRDVLSKAA